MSLERIGEIGYAAIVDLRVPEAYRQVLRRRPVAITDRPARRSYSTSQSQDTSRPSAAAESIASTTVWDCANGRASAQPAGFFASTRRAGVPPELCGGESTGRRGDRTHPR